MSRSRLLLITTLLAFVPLAAQAGGTHTHDVDSFDDFDSGEVEGAAIEGSGKLTRGYASSKTDIAASVAFSCLSDGKQAWVGTADAATIQTVKLQGKTPAVERLAELEGVVVSAMARLPGGDLVVATLPGGKLMRVDGKGKVSDFAELKVETIWTIVPHAGRLLIGTGPEGELWSIGTDGKDAKVVLDTPDKDLLAVLPVGEAILVGAAPKARLYMVGDKLEGVLLHEFAGDELRSLAISGDQLIAAVNDFEDRSISSRQALTSQLNRSSLTGEKPQDTNTDRARASADAELWAVDLGSKRDVQRAQDAGWDKWLGKANQYFIDLLAVDDRGTVLAASSAGGKIYRVRGRRDVSVIADLEQRQATALCALPDGDVLATAGDGAGVHVLQSKAAAKARWVSKVFDAKRPARYGAFVLEGKGKLELRVRTGPTAEVDDRWSEWKSVALTRSNVELRGSADLPQRRYLQVEVVLVDADSELRELSVFHAPENLSPLVEAIAVEPPSFSFSDDDETKSTIKIDWEVEAGDGDDMIYDLRIRPEGGGDDEWIKLNQDGPLDKKEFSLDLDTLPDGIYELQLTASDEPAVGSAAARTDVLISEPFVVDRTRPALEGVKVEGSRITGVAKDQGGFVHDVGFAIDGGGFRAASPSDGVFDSASERFEIALPGDLGPGPHRVVVRARDARGNLETSAIEVP
ncbi:hypothetical protein ACNOYE_06500 [Nannocystaceae bacterium ST9]